MVDKLSLYIFIDQWSEMIAQFAEYIDPNSWAVSEVTAVSLSLSCMLLSDRQSID